jgi:hypothetical protein
MRYIAAHFRMSLLSKTVTSTKLMKIGCSNCRANCARVLLTDGVSVAASAIEPPLVTGLRSDKDSRICWRDGSFAEQRVGRHQLWDGF